MLRKRVSSKVSTGAAILAGALTFMGEASAVNLVTETFDGPNNIFSAPTYNYSLNYTLANTLNPAGGVAYAHGGAGVAGSVSSKTLPAAGNPFSLQMGGITGSLIDTGKVNYNFYAQFSTYKTQNDFGVLSLQFLNASSAPIGAPITIGGSNFVTALATGPGDFRGWAADQKGGLIPVGARSASLSLEETKTAGGTNIDGYIDNVLVTANVIPEPSAGVMGVLGGTLLLFRRRRSA